MAFRNPKSFREFQEKGPFPLKCFKISTNFHLTMNLIAQKMQFYITTSRLLSNSFGSIVIKNKIIINYLAEATGELTL